MTVGVDWDAEINTIRLNRKIKAHAGKAKRRIERGELCGEWQLQLEWRWSKWLRIGCANRQQCHGRVEEKEKLHGDKWL